MAWPDLHAIRHSVQYRLDAVHQCWGIPPWQVRPTHTPTKQNIASNQPIALLIHKYYMARGMAWRPTDGQPQVAKNQAIPIHK